MHFWNGGQKVTNLLFYSKSGETEEPIREAYGNFGLVVGIGELLGVLFVQFGSQVFVGVDLKGESWTVSISDKLYRPSRFDTLSLKGIGRGRRCILTLVGTEDLEQERHMSLLAHLPVERCFELVGVAQKVPVLR